MWDGIIRDQRRYPLFIFYY